MVNAGDIIRASDVAAKSCRVTHNATQSIPHNTLTIVSFNTEESDTDVMHNVTTNNSRITIQTAGTYLVGFNGILASAADYSHIRAVLLVNGATTIAIDRRPGTGAGVDQTINVSTTYPFDAGDYVQVQVGQVNTASAARNLNAAVDNTPEFWAARIGS
jgi:hypothetical protein